MNANAFNSGKYLNKFNQYLEDFYSIMGETLFPNKKKDIHIIKQYYRDLINDAKDDEFRMIINISCEYFESSEDRISSYNSEDLTKLKRFDKFTPNLLIIMNELEGLKEYLKSEKNILNKEMDDRLRSLLYVACKCGYKKIVIFLLEQGAISDTIQISGSTPLHAACYYRHAEIVSLLLQVGSSLSVKNKFGYLPENETNGIIKKLILSFKSNKNYNTFIQLKPLFRNIKLVVYEDEIVGKRCSVNESYNKIWDLAWQGTKLDEVLCKINDKEQNKNSDFNIINDDEFERPEIKEIESSSSIFYATIRKVTEHFTYFKEQEWLVVIECRLKPNSYESKNVEIKDYNYNLNEDSAIINISTSSNDVLISAVWFFNKNFISSLRDYSTMIELVKGYIP